MIYYNDTIVLIRTIQPSDTKVICEEEIAQGWHQTEEKYLMRLEDHTNGKSIGLVAEYKGHVAGYVNVYLDVTNGPFVSRGYCEIVDFGVLEKYQKRGIGNKLMSVAEMIASNYSDTVFLAVGLYNSYGSAQRMYHKRGYLPDGSGAWYGNKLADPYENYCLDDDLVIYLSKRLR